MQGKELGKIIEMHFGLEDNRIGFSFTLGGESWGVGTKYYGHFHKRAAHVKWTTEQQINACGLAMLELADLLEAAKKRHVHELVGIPIEATFENSVLVSWRILKEVL